MVTLYCDVIINNIFSMYMHMCISWITCTCICACFRLHVHAHVHVLDYMYILLHVNNTSPYIIIALHVPRCYGNQVLRRISYPNRCVALKMDSITQCLLFVWYLFV